jgi:hypothetical protein
VNWPDIAAVVPDVVPQYTSEAMRAGIEGAICPEAVADVDGHTGGSHRPVV